MAAGDENSPVFDFTSMDFASMRDDLIRYAQQIFTEEVWTDFNDSNEGTRLIELKSYATDLLSYNQNARVRETVVASLIRRQNFINASKTYDFVLKSAAPSTTVLEFGIDPAFTPFVLPSTFKVSDADQVIFQPDADVNVPGAATSIQVAATQGDEQSNEALAFSNGETFQVYQLAQQPLIDDTLILTVNGVQWEQIVNFIEAGPTDEVYRIETDEDDITTIEFGDGVNGKVPPITQPIVATYKTGGGDQGNLPIGTITRLVSSLAGVNSVTNVTAATGGGPRQSLTSAKRLLPLSIKANQRAVTLQDYATHAAQNIAGVLKAKGVAGLFEAGGSPVILFTVPNGGGDVSQTLASQIVAYFRSGAGTEDGEPVGLAGKRVVPRTAAYVRLSVEIEVYVRPGSNADATGERVSNIYLNRYSLENVDFADAFDLQDAYNTADPVEKRINGLQRVFLRRFSIAPHGGKYVNKATTGDGTVDNVTTSVDAQRREWNIVVRSGVTLEFDVISRRLGTVSQVFDTTLIDEEANYQEDEVTGLTLQPRYQESEELWTITESIGTTLIVNPVGSEGTNGLLQKATQGDEYAINEPDPKPGKIIRSIPLADVADGVTTISADDITGWVAGDLALVREGSQSEVKTIDSTEAAAPNITTIDVDTLVNDTIIPVASTAGLQVGRTVQLGAAGDIRRIASIDPGVSITIDEPATQAYNIGENVSLFATIIFTTPTLFALTTSSTVDYYWESTDGTVGFAIVNGATAFVAGDEFYVDTYGEADDIKLRPENYLLFEQDDLTIFTIGGVK